MTWEEAEVIVPGCSALWDVLVHQWVGPWTLHELFYNAMGGVTARVVDPLGRTQSYTIHPTYHRFPDWTYIT